MFNEVEIDEYEDDEFLTVLLKSFEVNRDCLLFICLSQALSNMRLEIDIAIVNMICYRHVAINI